MKYGKPIRKLSLITLLVLACCFGGKAQVFWQDNFENASTPDIAAGSARTPSMNTGSSPAPSQSYFKRSTNIGADASFAFATSYSGMSGTYIWAGENHDAAGGTENALAVVQTIEWTNISISGKTNIDFKGLFGANNTNGSWDNANTGGSSPAGTTTGTNDFILVEYAIDAGAYQQLMVFYGDDLFVTGGKTLKEDTNGDGIGDGTQLTGTLQEITKHIAGSGTTMKIRISVRSNSGNEEWAIDNFRLTNTVALTPTTTGIGSSLNPSTYGANVTFTATVSPAAATGTVTFKDGATTLGTGTLSSGTATYSTTALSVASHPITAVYDSNASYATSTSGILAQVVNKASTTTGLGSSLNPSTVGANVTFTATVSPATATGTVTFKDGGTILGTGSINSGTATYSTTALTVATHSITAVYDGDGNYLTSTSSGLSQVVNQVSYTWAGGTGSWATATNWSPNGTPSSVNNVTIPSGSPAISGVVSCNNITVNGTGSLTVPAASTLQIAGTITSASLITVTAGGIELNGTTAQTIPANVFASNTVKNLKASNAAGVTLAGTLNITGIFTPAAGQFTTSGFLVFRSTSITNTAMLGVVTGSISGNVTVERYIPASNRAFRFIAPGVTTSSTIKANWQEGVNVTSATAYPNAGGTATNPNAGYGTHITGSTVGVNGFDATVNGSASLFTYNNTTQAWVAVANTNASTLNAQTGYRILIRGDRSSDLRSNTPTVNATTLRATGTLTTGTVNITELATGNNQYSFIGNPYWAAVDWTALQTGATNIGTTYWIWDPTIAGTNGRGGYTSFTRTGPGSGATSGGGSINKNIQPGQAFFVQHIGAGTILPFNESNKDLSTAFTNTFREAGNNSGTKGLISIRLYLKTNYANKQAADGISMGFRNDFSTGADVYDAEKFPNPDESISIKRNGQYLGFDARPAGLEKDTIFLDMGNMLSKHYVLEMEGRDFMDAGTRAFLYDGYLKTFTSIDIAGTTTVDYDIDSNPASAKADRFMIVVKREPILLTASTNGTQLKIVPNPVTDLATISYSTSHQDNASIRIVDMNGKTIHVYPLGVQQAGQFNISLAKLPTGTYLVQFEHGSSLTTAKFIKQ